MPRLEQIIRQEIAAAGPISFARFMDLALYHPLLGYYENDRQQVGRSGDFYTSVSVGSLFGELLGFQFGYWIKAFPAGSFQLIEAGAHDGQLASDILSFLRSHLPDVFREVQYWILEPSERRRKWQRDRLREFEHQVGWFNSLESLLPKCVRGIIFSNEFLDAFPVHRLVWDAAAQTWFELGVTAQNGELIWKRMDERDPRGAVELYPFARPTLPPELLALLPDGFIIETSPAASAWWGKAAGAISEGYLLTLDYGLRAEQFFAPERAEGTVRAYHQHHLRKDLLACAGEQDLTAHVNFTALQEIGEAAGLVTIDFLHQQQFLTRIARQTWQTGARFNPWSTKRIRQFQTLTHPEHFGRSFHVLIQSSDRI